MKKRRIWAALVLSAVLCVSPVLSGPAFAAAPAETEVNIAAAEDADETADEQEVISGTQEAPSEAAEDETADEALTVVEEEEEAAGDLMTEDDGTGDEIGDGSGDEIGGGSGDGSGDGTGDGTGEGTGDEDPEVPEDPAPAIVASGSAGASAVWQLDENGLFTITGSGTIRSNYDSRTASYPYPWTDYRDQILEVVIGEGIERLGQEMFINCQNLKSFKVLDPETKLSGAVSFFEGCSSLTTVVLPKIKYVAVDMFMNCTSLKVITIPEGTEELNIHAFRGCTSLQRMNLPASLTEIDEECAPDSTKLSEIYYAGTVAQWKDLWNDYLSDGDEETKFLGKAHLMFGTYELSEIEVKTSSNQYVYTGTERRPAVTVTISGYPMVKGKDYKIAGYTNNINIGKAAVKIKLIGEYSGTKSKAFRIVPAAVSGFAYKAITGGVKVTWTKISGITGYQIQYSTSSKFTSSTTKTIKAGSTKTAKNITGLVATKKYYVRIRAYKTVGGTDYCSSWKVLKQVVPGKAIAPASKLTVKTAVTVTAGFKSAKILTYSTKLYKTPAVTWKTSNSAVATVSKAGIVIGHKPGTCTLTCVYKGTAKKCKVTVRSNEFSGVSFGSVSTTDHYDYMQLWTNHLSYNSKGQLVVKMVAANRRMFRADYFDWLDLSIFDKDGNKIAFQRFTGVPIGLAPYSKKYMTFTFTTGTKKVIDLRKNGSCINDYEYYYHYSY